MTPLELEIVESAIEDIINAGYSISVHQEHDVLLRDSKDLKEIIGKLTGEVEDQLTVEHPLWGGGWIEFSYGNKDELTVIQSYSPNIKNHIGLTLELIEKYEEEDD